MKIGKREEAKLKRRAGLCKALGHPARVLIVSELAKEEHCVCELVEKVDLGFSTVSRHLLQLKTAGLIEDEKRGQQVYYRITCSCLPEFFECLDGI